MPQSNDEFIDHGVVLHIGEPQQQHTTTLKAATRGNTKWWQQSCTVRATTCWRLRLSSSRVKVIPSSSRAAEQAHCVQCSAGLSTVFDLARCCSTEWHCLGLRWQRWEPLPSNEKRTAGTNHSLNQDYAQLFLLCSRPQHQTGLQQPAANSAPNGFNLWVH
jgi:hypothetical protein